MELNKEAEDIVRKATSSVFDKALQDAVIKGLIPKERLTNPSQVGSGDENFKVVFLFQPHDYRLYFDFNKENFKVQKPSDHELQNFKSMVAIFNTAYSYTALNHASEHEYKDFYFCTIRVKKNQVEVTNNYHKKQWRRILASSVNEVDERIDAVMKDLKDHSIKALEYFIRLHGGSSKFRILKERAEHGIHGDDYLDKIPQEMIINDTYVKKLYTDKVEFKSTAAIKNYVSNRAVEKVYPELALELNKLHLKAEEQAKSSENMQKDIESSTVKIDAYNVLLMRIASALEDYGKSQGAFAENIRSHLQLINDYRQEVLDMKKPFWVRWREYYERKKAQ